MNTEKGNLDMRYHRQRILVGFGQQAQDKLWQAKVLVVGAGGLGCPALQYLAGAGVGTIGIIDQDTVSLVNLHRQPLYTSDDIGKYKSTVAAARLAAINPEIIINSYPIQLENANALTLISEYDVIIDGTDNFASRYLINDACVLLKKPLIHASVSAYEGQIAIFNVADEAGQITNYRDLFPDPAALLGVENCDEIGVLGPLPGIIGSMQAAEAIKLICQIGKPLINRLLTYNILSQQTYEIAFTASSDSHTFLPQNKQDFLSMDYERACLGEMMEVEISLSRFKQYIQEGAAIVIDVREKGEMPSVNGLKHIQIPLSVFKEHLPDIQHGTVLLFCQYGSRSLKAASIIQQAYSNNKKVYSLQGGIMAYSEELELY